MAYIIKKKACALAGATVVGAFVLGSYLRPQHIAELPSPREISRSIVEHTTYTSPESLTRNLTGSQVHELRSYLTDEMSLGAKWNLFSEKEKYYILQQGVSELSEKDRNAFLNKYFEEAALARGKSAFKRAESAIEYLITPKDDPKAASATQQQHNQQLLEERLR